MKTCLASLAMVSFAVSFASAAKMSLEEHDRVPYPVIDDASEETALAVQQLKLPEGIEAKLWAAEPMLANPVAFDFDEQGRLFVTETYRYLTSVIDIRNYMDMVEEDLAFRSVEDRREGIEELFGEDARGFAIEGEILRLLEDRDRDGVADHSSIYADGFNTSVDGIASGVLARQGDVYFTNIPNLWKFDGIDEEGSAEQREKLLSGFGVHFGFTGHDLHGLILGPDGKLYFSIGDRGANVETKEGETIAYQDTGAVYRCNLDGTDLEIVHWGLRNPQELAFDEFGNLFTGDNDCDNGDYERLVLIAEGGDSGWRVGHQQAPLGRGGVWISEGWWKTRFEGRTKFALPPISYVDDGPSGIAFHPGTGLSPEYEGHLFMTHFKGSIASSGITTYKLKPDGAWFELDEKKDFLSGILPTDVTFAPDGKFYVLDWVNGWPKSKKGRVYALANPNYLETPIVKQTQELIATGMSERPVNELGELLSHPNWNVRLEAQLELASRGETGIQILSAIATDESAGLRPRLHATWGLGIAAREESSLNATIVGLASSSDAEIRAQATKLIGDLEIGDQQELLVSHLQDESLRVRYFAAQSIGKLGIEEATPALLKAAEENADQDPYLSHAIVMGLVGSKNLYVMAENVTHESNAVRSAILLTYRRLGDVNIARFLHDEDEHIVLDAARAINDAPVTSAYASLAAILESPLAQNPILGLRAINAHFRLGKASNAEALAKFASNEQSPLNLRLEVLQQMATWGSPLQRDRIMGVYQPLESRPASVAGEALTAVADDILASDKGEIVASFITAIGALGITELSDSLCTLASDPERPGTARVAAFNALVAAQDPRLDELVLMASESNASELRLATLPILTETAPEQAEVTLELMSKGSVEEQRVAYKTLAKSKQAFAETLLIDSLTRLTDGKVPYGAQLELLEATESHPSKTIKTAYQSYQSAIAADPDPIAPYRFALDGGERRPGGSDAFMDNKIMACVRCHIVYGPGESAGPNLADIGLRLDKRQLLEAIVAPNASIADGWNNVIVTLKDQSSKAGILESEDDDRITLKLVSGETETLRKSDIANTLSMPSSMPAVFGSMLSKREIRDLVAFLEAQRWQPGDRAAHGEE
ncbi:DUF7133 domain-containing protein [Pelagicoccus albus]|uniref:HEAT repeat domain-containing protein n=1 Tax=Pelagicoccus albus TaxID=415222 RepID=A0A7X1B3N2_9BACT|nr:HEAT repeat domain-containing protein [Pelagicoccus albus]MBC2604922.1 HEAT repeat domain-containing protein [Pelagicoccus albus]